MDKYKNATLDSLSILALGSGIALIPTDALSGILLVLVGGGISLVKYHLRERSE